MAVCAGLLALAPAARADDKPGERGEGESSKSGMRGASRQDTMELGQSVSGTVTKIGRDTVQLRSDQGDITLHTDGTTKVFGQKGESTSFSQLREGEHVRASFDTMDGKKHASRIDVAQLGGTGGAASGTGGQCTCPCPEGTEGHPGTTPGGMQGTTPGTTPPPEGGGAPY